MIDLVPLKLFSERLREGWRMVPGYPLNPGDYAVTLMSPDHDERKAREEDFIARRAASAAKGSAAYAENCAKRRNGTLAALSRESAKRADKSEAA